MGGIIDTAARNQGFWQTGVNSVQQAMNNSLAGELAAREYAKAVQDRQLQDAKAEETRAIINGIIDPRQAKFLNQEDVRGLMQGLAGMATNMSQVKQ